MVTIFLCDDDSEVVKKYSELIKQIAKKYHIEMVLNTFKSGEQLLFRCYDLTTMPDIIYLDILMGKINGIDTAKHIRDIGCNAQIIFLTTSEEYVLESFDVLPMHYLVKEDTSAEKFEQVFMRAIKLMNNKKTEVFACESGNVQKLIPVKDILYFEIIKRVVTVHFGENETFTFYMTMSELEKQMLHKGFIRVYRSYIVNMQYITKFEPKSLLLKNGKFIPIGVTYQSGVKAAFLEYISGTGV